LTFRVVAPALQFLVAVLQLELQPAHDAGAAGVSRMSKAAVSRSRQISWAAHLPPSSVHGASGQSLRRDATGALARYTRTNDAHGQGCGHPAGCHRRL